MLFRQNPRLEGKPRGVRSQREKILVLGHDANAGLGLLPDDVAENTALFVNVVLLGALDFLSQVYREHWQSNQLGVRVLEGCASSFAVILEDQNELEAAVFFQIEDAVSKGPQHIFNTLRRQRGKGRVVIGSFDDHFVSPNAVHAVKHTFGLAVQAAFYTQGRKLIGHHTDCPTRGIALRWRASIRIGTIGLNFRWRLALVSIAERAKSALDLYRVTRKIGGPFGPVGGDDHPAANDGVFSELRQ